MVLQEVGGQMPSRICACVILNHPFPSILPALRRLFRGRFSKLLFLMPYERTEDDDVVSVYRGSYCHTGYVADAYWKLKNVECDHFLFIHDDVFLNPRINEDNFYEFFPLGVNDGFIPVIVKDPPSLISDWIWFFGHISRMLFPKSIFFGTGVESANLAKYLPSAESISQKISRQGYTACSKIKMDIAPANDVCDYYQAIRLLLHGFAKPLAHADATDALQEKCENIIRGIVDAYNLSEKMDGTQISDDGHAEIDLPFPLLITGTYTDFYILPKSGLEDFAHYIGITSSANLHAEVMTPTILCAVCDNMFTAEKFGLDFSGFVETFPLIRFRDKKFISIHPFKMSFILRSKEAADNFWNDYDRMLNGEYWDVPDVNDQSLMVNTTLEDTRILWGGWYPPEDWGCWSRNHLGQLQFKAQSNSMVRLFLYSPVNKAYPEVTGEIRVNGVTITTIRSIFEEGTDFVVEFLLPYAENSGTYIVDIITSNPLNPAALGLGLETRDLGFGLKRIDIQRPECECTPQTSLS